MFDFGLTEHVTLDAGCDSCLSSPQRENAAALVNVGEDWYGIVYSWADNKKKANLMLSLFEPGKLAGTLYGCYLCLPCCISTSDANR